MRALQNGIQFEWQCQTKMIHFRVFRTILSLAVVFFGFASQFAVAQQIALTVNYGINDGSHNESKMTIARNGSPWKLVRPAKPTNTETLDFSNNYLLTFEKPGYATRQVSINTGNIPKEVQANGMNLTISVQLSKEGSSSGDRLVKYAYDAAAKGFVQEAATPTLTQQAEARKRAEETLDLITKEEERGRQYKQHFNKEDALEGRKGEFSQKKEVELTEEQKQAQEVKKAAAIKAAEETKAAQLAKIEEQRKAMQTKENENAQVERKKQEEEQRVQIATIKAAEVERKAREVKAAEAAREAEAARAEEERRKQEALAKAELEKRKREAQQKFQQEQRNVKPAAAAAAEEKPMTIAEAGNIVSRTEEIIQEDKRVIKQITIKRERHTFVYRMVKYDWGGLFYFKNDMDMTKLDFDSETALKQ